MDPAPRCATGENGHLLLWCPGCESAHVIGPAWTWNGSRHAPTISPSVLVQGGPPGTPRCHSFVTDGRIEYLPDSEHALAGSTVDLPDWPPHGG